MSDIYNLQDALQMIQSVGNLVSRTEEGQLLARQIDSEFKLLKNSTRPIRAAYLIWQKPYMVAASGTFIDDMLQKAGFQNVFAHQNRYPEITLEALAAAQPEAILLSSEPYPFKTQHFPIFQQVCQQAVVQIVDGELFSWYGSRLLHSATYFRNLYRNIYAQLK